jgi:aerobic-type carbon monoxide dehydrogenase small subunit (CoxS/CutS family)
VIIDGQAARSCSLLAVQVDGSVIRTVEDLAEDGELSPMQQAFHENLALQCGFCTPGFLMTLESADPAEFARTDDLFDLLSGHLCRCTGYQNIIKAVASVWGDAETE